jgi:hypothetical protein
MTRDPEDEQSVIRLESLVSSARETSAEWSLYLQKGNSLVTQGSRVIFSDRYE